MGRHFEHERCSRRVRRVGIVGEPANGRRKGRAGQGRCAGRSGAGLVAFDAREDQVGIECTVVGAGHDGHGAAGLDGLDAGRRGGGVGDGLVIGMLGCDGVGRGTDDEVDVAVDVGHECGIAEQGGTARGLPDGVEGALDSSCERRIARAGDDCERPAEQEVDHRVDAPRDVVFDDDLFALPGAVVADSACAEEACGQAAFLGEAVVSGGGVALRLSRAHGAHGVSVVLPERAEARHGAPLVTVEQGVDRLPGESGICEVREVLRHGSSPGWAADVSRLPGGRGVRRCAPKPGEAGEFDRRESARNVRAGNDLERI